MSSKKKNEHNIHDEIHHFDDLADDWWNPKGSNRALHFIQPPRMEFINKHSVINGKSWLDVGCGAGLLTEALALAGASIVGIDLSSNMIRVAKEHAKIEKNQASYECTSLEDWSASNEKVSRLTCLELLEHVADPLQMVQQCANMVKTNGLCFFSTINRTGYSYLSAIFAAENILGWVKPGTHNYQQFIKPSELIRYCELARLTPVALSGINFTPFSFKLSANVAANYILVAKKS